MIKIKVNLGERSYPILIGDGITSRVCLEIKRHIKCKKIMVITDHTVNGLYWGRVAEILRKNDFSVCLTVIPDGENYKNIEQVKKIYNECINNNLHRDDCVIALGGGVISDLAGFVAATYMRGISIINMPTTLVGQADAAIGGKTGINFEAKNIVGSFYQPKLVLIDTNFLKTLPEKGIKNGLAEIIKYAIIKDARLFRFLEENKEKILNLDRNILTNIISRCCSIKARIVEKDEKEKNLRAILNYGHTIGHAIEKVSDYSVPHGEAVAHGMIIESKIARMLGLLDEKQEKRIDDLIKDFELIGGMSLKREEILNALQFDKKMTKDKSRFILPVKIGKVCATDVPEEIIRQALF